jgi:hypothetical protein
VRLYEGLLNFDQSAGNIDLKKKTVNPSSVTFTWNGNTENYLFYYSTDPNFVDVVPILNKSDGVDPTNSYRLSHRILASLFFAALRIRSKKLQLLTIVFTFITLYISCDMGRMLSPFVPSTTEHHQTVQNLHPDTVYYWKVVAIDTESIYSKSIVHEFRTSN